LATTPDNRTGALREKLDGAAVSDTEHLIAEQIPKLRRYARALLGDPIRADDLVQDTLVRALRSEHLFHGGDVRSWGNTKNPQPNPKTKTIFSSHITLIYY
jgi:DNA-directed RNA polymerase specialized sigma24 family protein